MSTDQLELQLPDRSLCISGSTIWASIPDLHVTVNTKKTRALKETRRLGLSLPFCMKYMATIKCRHALRHVLQTNSTLRNFAIDTREECIFLIFLHFGYRYHDFVVCRELFYVPAVTEIFAMCLILNLVCTSAEMEGFFAKNLSKIKQTNTKRLIIIMKGCRTPRPNLKHFGRRTHDR